MRPLILLKKSCALDFNPRTPYGMRRETVTSLKRLSEISIHAPLTGCDPVLYVKVDGKDIFQSTHPLRDATADIKPLPTKPKNFNPRTPYGMRLFHAHNDAYIAIFQSTHPLRDATSFIRVVHLQT